MQRAKDKEIEGGLTLIELLVVLLVIAILAALLIAALSGAKANARRTTCRSNLKQIGLAVLTYADEHNDAFPTVGHAEFVDLAKRHTGVAAVQPDNKLFACPDDRFYYAMPHGSNEYIAEPLHCARPSFSSYTYNCGNLLLNSRTGQTNSPGIAGRLVSAIREPSKTVLVGDIPAWQGWSWHYPRQIKPPYLWCFDNARNMIAFIDGHVSNTKIHFNLMNGPSSYYDPPVTYDYKWSGD